MREIMALLKITPPEAGENIAKAKGKYEFTGKILADTIKIIRNGRNNIN